MTTNTTERGNERLIANVLDVRPACALHADREAAAKLPDEPEDLADEEVAGEVDDFTKEVAA